MSGLVLLALFFNMHAVPNLQLSAAVVYGSVAAKLSVTHALLCLCSKTTTLDVKQRCLYVCTAKQSCVVLGDWLVLVQIVSTAVLHLVAANRRIGVTRAPNLLTLS